MALKHLRARNAKPPVLWFDPNGADGGALVTDSTHWARAAGSKRLRHIYVEMFPARDIFLVKLPSLCRRKVVFAAACITESGAPVRCASRRFTRVARVGGIVFCVPSDRTVLALRILRIVAVLPRPAILAAAVAVSFCFSEEWSGYWKSIEN